MIVIVTELFNNIFIINNLGINPVNGGIPPSDSILIEKIMVHQVSGFFIDHKSFRLFLLYLLNIISNGRTIIE